MNDGTEPQAIAILTAAWMREQGNANPPPYIASIKRVDGEVVEMIVTNIDHVATLLQSIVPQLKPSNFRLLRGRNENKAQQDIVEILNTRLMLH